jgi:methionyl-tRNA formyltransferase
VKVAGELGIDLIQPEKLHDESVLEQIKELDVEALCVCAYGVLIKEPLLSEYELINIHPSLLPRWRGAAPIERAMMAGDRTTGVSIMRLTAGLDSGPIFLQEEEEIRPDDTFGTLAKRLELLGARLLGQVLDNRTEPSEQDEAQVTYAEKITAEDRALDFTQNAYQVERVVRALTPHIGARIKLGDNNFLGVSAAGIPESEKSSKPGYLNVQEDRLFLGCKDGPLELIEIKPPGGKQMAASAWLRGHVDAALLTQPLPSVHSEP